MEYKRGSECDDESAISSVVSQTRCASNPSGTLHFPNPLLPCYDYEVIKDDLMTAAQRMEKQFFLHLISLVNEVQGKQKLPSQFNSTRKSSWVKQVSNPKQKTDALSRI